MNEAYVFCEGYARIGWTPDVGIESWLTNHILAFVIQEYPEVYNPTTLLSDHFLCEYPASRYHAGG
jgi:hypothetical protein